VIAAGALDVSDAHQRCTPAGGARHLSGAAIGGAMFGADMILARGCSTRWRVLAAQGNLRALLSGLVFAISAQSVWSARLSPMHLALAGGGRWRSVRRATCWC